MKTLSLDTKCFIPYSNLQSKGITYNEKVTV